MFKFELKWGVLLSLLLLVIIYWGWTVSRLSYFKQIVAEQAVVLEQLRLSNQQLVMDVEIERKKTQEVVAFSHQQRMKADEDIRSISQALQQSDCSRVSLPVDVIRRLQSVR